jgi:hypothetical protein
MTPNDQSEWHVIRESQIRTEEHLKTLIESRDDMWDLLRGDGTDSNPGIIKDIDRLKQRQSLVSGWLGAAWGLITLALGALATWAANQGGK